MPGQTSRDNGHKGLMPVISNTFDVASKLHKLMRVSATMPNDIAFARQARRKYV